MGQVNFNIGPPEKPEDKTAILVCNWCQEPHKVTPEYKQDMMKRGEEKIAALKKNSDIPEDAIVEVDQSWTCGRCMSYLMSLPAGRFRTDCHPHDVPEKRRDPS